MGRFLVFTASCLTLAGCAVRPDRSADSPDVLEAVFRYRLQKHPHDVRAYLAVDGQDPPEELSSRLRKDWPNLAPASEEPKEKGLRFHVEGLKWIDRDTAEVEAGYWFPTKFAGEGYFGVHRVVREGGRWVVQKVTDETMS
jgi:hypothetical protein